MSAASWTRFSIFQVKSSDLNKKASNWKPFLVVLTNSHLAIRAVQIQNKSVHWVYNKVNAMHKTNSYSTEILLLLKSDCSKSKKVFADTRSISNQVNVIDLLKTKSTGTIWQNILSKLDLSPKELLDKSSPYYQANIRGRDFEERDWTILLMNNPSLIRGPIVIKGNKARLIDNPTDIYKM